MILWSWTWTRTWASLCSRTNSTSSLGSMAPYTGDTYTWLRRVYSRSTRSISSRSSRLPTTNFTTSSPVSRVHPHPSPHPGRGRFHIHGVEQAPGPLFQQGHRPVGLDVHFVSFPGKGPAQAVQRLEQRFAPGKGHLFPGIAADPPHQVFLRQMFPGIGRFQGIAGVTVAAPQVAAGKTDEHRHGSGPLSFSFDGIEQFHHGKCFSLHKWPRSLPIPGRKPGCRRGSGHGSIWQCFPP